MSIFAQAVSPYKAELSTIKNPKEWLLDSFGGKTTSKINVNERRALTLSAYYDGVNLLSNHIAYLPFSVIQKDLTTGNRDNVTDHPVYDLMKWEANNRMTAFTFKKTMTIHMLNWGDAFAHIKREGAQVRSLELLEPWDVKILENKATGDIFYKVDGYNRYLTPREVLHLHQFSLDGIKGQSIIQAGARDRIGGHIAAEQYGETFFGNATHMGGLLITEDSLGADDNTVNEAKSEIRQELDNVYSDPRDGWHRVGILDGKWEYQNMTLKASDAQLIERTQATVQDIARWLGVPVSKLKAKQNDAYNTREHEAIDYVQDGLMPRATVWTQETRRKLFTEEEKRQGYETLINVKDLLRGDLKSLAEFLTNMIDRTVFTPNDAREFLGEDTFEGGDVHMMPMNYTTLERFLNGETDEENTV